MSESNTSLEKLRFEIQTVETELKARRRAFKKLERETQAQLREMDLQTQSHTDLINCKAESYNKYTGLIKDTVEDLNGLLRHMIAVAKGETTDNSVDLIEKLELKLLDKAKAENTRMQEVWLENDRQSNLVPVMAQKLLDTYNTEKAKAAEFAEQAQARIKELEEAINQIRNASGHE